MEGAPDMDQADAGAIVRNYCDAWLAGDVAALFDAYHDDVVLEWPGEHDLAGEHRGKDAALTALITLQAATDRKVVRVHDVTIGERSVVALVTERWTRDTESVELDRALEYTVADGLILMCRIYESDQAAVDEWLT
ncbi:MAG: nuclear transport factor 2 family protein [Acidimicrobiia bacterium]